MVLSVQGIVNDRVREDNATVKQINEHACLPMLGWSGSEHREKFQPLLARKSRVCR
jgi:hypothetical protein